MKYKIGQVLYPGWIDEEDFDEEWHKCTIVCIALFDNFTWKYGIQDKDSEYGNMEYGDMIDFCSEDEIDEDYIIIGGEG